MEMEHTFMFYEPKAVFSLNESSRVFQGLLKYSQIIKSFLKWRGSHNIYIL